MKRKRSRDEQTCKIFNVLVLFLESVSLNMSSHCLPNSLTISSVVVVFLYIRISSIHLVPGGAGSAGGGGEEEVPSREEAEGAYHWTGGGHQYCGLR